LKKKQAASPLKLDLGCGKNKREGFVGVDSRQFAGVDQVVDLRKPWPWKDGSVSEAHSSHFVEHLTAPERIHFVNELYRVLAPGAKAQIIVPHWASARAYGDLTHQWPPVSEFWFYYLDKSWRAQNAPHNDFYTCDFQVTWGYGMHPSLAVRNAEYQQYAIQNFKEAISDIAATWEARK
jgi:hypothetical protein